MKYRNLLISVAVLAAIQFTGCAFSNANLKLGELPASQGKSPLSTLAPTTIALQVEDKRDLSERDRVGNKRNGWGMETAKIASATDVVGVVSDALKHELENNGHKVVDASSSAAADYSIHVALNKFWTDIKIHFTAVDVLGNLDTDVVISGVKSATTLLSKPMNAMFRKSSQLVTENDYKAVLDGALSEYIRAFSRDPDVLDALQGKKSGK